ncbi:MAG: septum formation initiator family protein [Treponema sp.]|nr:septum formation initiator family protein [Treponema sp.]
MKCLPFLHAACLGTLVYVLVSITGGHDGIIAQKKLAEQKMNISLRTAEIQKINTELSLEYTAILKDPDVIAAYARKLGYVADGEKLVKISGLPLAPVMQYNTGTVLKRTEIICLPEWLCKAMGLATFVCAALFFLLYEYKRGMLFEPKKKKFETLKGIPLYDLPQV